MTFIKLLPQVLSLFILGAGGCLSSIAAEVVRPPDGGVSLFPGIVEPGLRLIDGQKIGEKKLIPVEGMEFKQAVEFRTREVPTQSWSLQLISTIPAAIHVGDVLWFTLWVRTSEGEANPESMMEVVIERSTEPYEKLAMINVVGGKEWQPVAVPFVATKEYAINGAQLCLRGGYKPQAIQIGGIQLLNFGTTRKLSELPRTPIRYPGMEPDAPWRKQAAERIERYRKAELTVVVKNAAGEAVPGATVSIHQIRHAFGFGSCVVTDSLMGVGPDFDRYREIVVRNFSKVVFENDLKWSNWEHSAEHKKRTLAAMQWLQKQGLQIRGHNLVWPSWRFLPKELPTFKDRPEALRKQVAAHIEEEVTATRGLISDWDVINEPYSNHDLMDMFGPGIMVEWFALARKYDPAPVLVLNDYAGLMARGLNTAHKKHFEKTIRYLMDSGAPIGALGIQAHFNEDPTPPELILQELDRWAVFGLDIQVTEFDIHTDDEAFQAQYTRDFMTAIFSHPSVSCLLTWGFWEKQHWMPNAAFYRKDWSLKPNGQVWNDLVLKEWHTDLAAPSDAAGKVSTRGFMGQYQVTVEYQGKIKNWPVTLGKEGSVVTATLD